MGASLSPLLRVAATARASRREREHTWHAKQRHSRESRETWTGVRRRPPKWVRAPAATGLVAFAATLGHCAHLREEWRGLLDVGEVRRMPCLMHERFEADYARPNCSRVGERGEMRN
eukprot:scaffold133702_cov37-Tisochrysis_lutea.AAC.1